MVKKRKYGRGHTPTTSEKWTGIRDPRAAVRFSLDERVAWWGDEVMIGVVIGFVDDECALRVQLENGSTVIWPTISARLRRVQTPDYDSSVPATRVEPSRKADSLPEITPIGEPLSLDQDPYDEMEVERDEDRDTIDVSAYTLPGDRK